MGEMPLVLVVWVAIVLLFASREPDKHRQ